VTVGNGGSGYRAYRMIAGVNAQQHSIVDRAGFTSETVQIFDLAAGDFTTSWTKTAGVTGLLSNGSTVQPYYVTGSATGSSENIGFALFYQLLRTNLYHGKFAAFVRCRQTSGAAGDLQVGIGVAANGYHSFINTNYVNMPIMTPGTTGIRDYDAVYCGEISIPLAAKADSGQDGRGLSDGEFYLGVNIKNNNASARTFQVLDVVLIPITEGSIQTTMFVSASFDPLPALYILYDNTFYLTHGEASAKTIYQAGTTNNTVAVEAETRGNLMLQPNRDNRIYFHIWHFQTNEYSNYFSSPADIAVYLNIVPRSYGPRTD